MTPKEAADVIKNPMKYSMEERTEADRMAAEALEKVEKYRWHDLREDPNDLPDDEHCLLLTVHELHGRCYGLCTFKNGLFSNGIDRHERLLNESIVKWIKVEDVKG